MIKYGFPRGRYFNDQGEEVKNIKQWMIDVTKGNECAFCFKEPDSGATYHDPEKGELYTFACCKSCIEGMGSEKVLWEEIEQVNPDAIYSLGYKECPIFRTDNDERLLRRKLGHLPVDIEGSTFEVIEPKPVILEHDDGRYVLFFRDTQEAMLILQLRDRDVVRFFGQLQWEDKEALFSAVQGDDQVAKWAKEVIFSRMDAYKPNRQELLMGLISGLGELLGTRINEDGECDCDECRARREAEKANLH